MGEAIGILASIAFCILVCSCLSIGEASISSVGIARAQAYGEENHGLSRLIEWELNDRQKVIITILIAHNLFAVAASSLATVLATRTWGHAGIFIATLTLTAIAVVFEDFLPKCVGMALGERVFPLVLPFLKLFHFVLQPLVTILDKIVGGFGRLFNVDMILESSIITRDEIEEMVKSGEESGVLEADERRMIDGVISFDETRVSEIMVPRVDMNALEDSQTVSDLIGLIHEWEHSRIPVFHETPDEIVGVVYVKDIIDCLRSQNVHIPLRTIVREALFVPETMFVNDLFNLMRSQHVHFAVVVDEYGGTAGIVTLEDMLEEIVGEIRDEYDEEDAGIVQLNENCYRVKCSESLEDLALVVGYDFDCDDVDSVGGYVLDKFHGFPQKGAIFTDNDWTIKVTDAEPHRVNEVLFIRKFNKTIG